MNIKSNNTTDLYKDRLLNTYVEKILAIPTCLYKLQILPGVEILCNYFDRSKKKRKETSFSCCIVKEVVVVGIL